MPLLSCQLYLLPRDPSHVLITMKVRIYDICKSQELYMPVVFNTDHCLAKYPGKVTGLETLVLLGRPLVSSNYGAGPPCEG